MMKPAAINTPCFRPPLLPVCVPRHNPCFLANNGLFSGLSLVSLPNARAFSLTVRATENSNQVIFLNSIYYVKISWLVLLLFYFLIVTRDDVEVPKIFNFWSFDWKKEYILELSSTPPLPNSPFETPFAPSPEPKTSHTLPPSFRPWESQPGAWWLCRMRGKLFPASGACESSAGRPTCVWTCRVNLYGWWNSAFDRAQWCRLLAGVELGI